MSSENGWEPAWVGEDRLNWVDIPGCAVRVQTQKGQPTAILRAWIADHNAFIEPVRDRDTASYTPTNSVSTSNHLNGTAADICWENHPFHVKGTFTPAQMRTLREMLDFYEDTIFWAGDWASPIDEMHVQLGYDTYNNPHTQDFINRKIRSDGYSTFRRGAAPAPLAAADVLARATGLTTPRAGEILASVSDGLRASQCDTPKRIAMWLAQIGHESGSFQYTEEIAKDGRYAPYIGRTWIQITWESNYSQFGQWANRLGLINDAEYFVKNPQRLADLQWAGLGAAWYWTVARPEINAKADAGDLRGVTQLINGGQNGYADRLERYNRALAVGDELLAITTGTTASADPLEELLMSDPVESLSLYATPGEPKIPIVRMLQNVDAAQHRELVENDARYGDPDALSRIIRVAAGQGKYKTPGAVNHAKAVLADIEANNPAVLKNYLASKGQ